MPWDRIALARAALALALATTPPAEASDTDEMSIATLKRIYVDCERRALTGVLPADEIAECSEVYEHLKRRAFGGEWMRIHEWTKRKLNPGHGI